jgi:hypothetical protein
MTRDDVLAAYRPLRTSIQGVLKAAVSTCTKSDWRRAARLLCFDLEDLDDDDLLAAGHAEMVMDVGLFEPNQSGKRVYNRFLKSAGRKLPPADQQVAQALRGAFFSVFRVVSRHETAGIWLEDLLNDGPRIWIVDEAMEKSMPDGICFATRIFNAGDFHAGLGIAIPLSDEEVADYQALARDPAAEVAPGAFAPLAYREVILGNMLDVLQDAIADLSPAELGKLGELMLDLPVLPGLPVPQLRKRA